MKILHVCPLYPPSMGGNQVHIQLLSEQLAQLGDEVHVFTVNAIVPAQYTERDASFNLLPGSEKINGVHVRRFSVDYRLNALLFKRIIRMRGGYRGLHGLLGQSFDFWKDGPLVPAMLGAIRRLKPDIVTAIMNYSFTTYLCYLAKKLFGMKLVIMPITHLSDTRTFHPFLKTMYAAADHVIACTEFEQRHLTGRGVPAAKISALPLGIKTDICDGQDGSRIKSRYNMGNAPVVAYIGRHVKHKGIEALVESMRKVWRDFPEAKLFLVGETRSDFAPILTECLEKLTPGERAGVINVEYFTEEEKKDFFAAIDILVMASEIDCFGIVYLEAWLSRKPVIACKNTAQETIIDDGVNGLLVEYGNADDLAHAIRTLLADPELRTRMGAEGRAKVMQCYELSGYARRIKTTYERIIHTI